MKARPVNIKSPLGGIVRRTDYQSQPPYTTPAAQNVWPVGTPDLRQRIARRAGKVKLCAGTAGGQSRMLAVVPKPLGLTAGGASTTTWIVGSIPRIINWPDDIAANEARWSANGLYTTAGTSGGYDYQVSGDGVWYRWQTDATHFYLSKVLATASGDYFQSSDGIWFYYQTDTTKYWLRCAAVTDTVTTGTGAAAFGAVVAVGSKLWLTNQATPALEEWTTGALTSTSGRVAWALYYGDLYLLDGGTLKVMKPWTPSIGNVTASAGSIPTNCNLMRRMFGRLFMAQKHSTGWYASAIDDFTDWDYTEDWEDPSRAVAFTDAAMGELSGPITGLMPWGDDYGFLGCDNSLHILRGDPGAGGKLDLISHELGLIGDDAWCHTPEGDLLFMDWSGMFLVQKGSTTPQPVSREKLPSDLRDIDPSTYDVILRWDPKHDGAILSILPLTGASDSDPGEFWWFDWPTKSYWQLTFPTDKAPRYMEPFAWSGGYDHVLLMACDDGYLRHFHNTATTDDGTAITGYCSIGPIRIAGNELQDGMIRELVGTLGTDSGDATWKIFVGESAEDAAIATTARESGTWVAGRNRTERRVGRGGAMVLQLTGTTRWSFEGATAVLVPTGRQRI